MFLLLALALLSTLSNADGESRRRLEYVISANSPLGDGMVQTAHFDHDNAPGDDYVYFGHRVASSLSGSRVAASSQDYYHPSKVQVMEYDSAAKTWSQMGADITNPLINMAYQNGDYADYWGKSLDLNDDGTTIVIGLRSFNCGMGSCPRASHAGYVFVFKWDGTAWNQMGQTIDEGEMPPDNFGKAVSLSGDGMTLAVGISDVLAGKAMVFKYVGMSDVDSTWVQYGSTLMGDRHSEGEDGSEMFGLELALSKDGTHLAVSAPKAWDLSDGSDAGRVRIFKDDGSEFVKVQDIHGMHWPAATIGNSPGDDKGDKLGLSLDLNRDGSVIVLGAYQGYIGAISAGEDRVGYAVVYAWDSGTNQYVMKGEKIPAPEGSNYFSFSLTMNADGDRIVVGDYYKENPVLDVDYAGAVWVYDFCEGVDQQWHQLTPNGVGGDDDYLAGDYYDYMGYHTDLSADGSQLIVGRKKHDEGGSSAAIGRATIVDLPNPSKMCKLGSCTWVTGADKEVNGVAIPVLGGFDGSVVGAAFEVVESEMVCKQNCVDHPLCNGYVFHSVQTRCWLKSGVSELADTTKASRLSGFCDPNAAPSSDCTGTFSACTVACETSAQRTFTETVAQSGDGAACPGPTEDCMPGDGACVAEADYKYDVLEKYACRKGRYELKLGSVSFGTRRALAPGAPVAPAKTINDCIDACTLEPTCTHIHTNKHKCWWHAGVVRDRFVNNANIKCYKKVMIDTLKTAACEAAKTLGICDKGGNTCSADIPESPLAAKICPYFDQVGLRWTSFCGLIPGTLDKVCPGTVSYTQSLGTSCKKNQLYGWTQSRAWQKTVEECKEICTADAACMGFHRRRKMCLFQSSIEKRASNTSKFSGINKEECYEKN